MDDGAKEPDYRYGDEQYWLKNWERLTTDQRAIGKKIGREEGREETMVETVRKLMSRGFALEEALYIACPDEYRSRVISRLNESE